jgi:adenosylmethionine-8-amino-7-oxononanoate aminotransferase
MTTALRADVVGEVRPAGMAIGIELVSDKEARTPMPFSMDVTNAVLDEFGVWSARTGRTPCR